MVLTSTYKRFILWMLLPALILVMIVIVFPIALALFLSFTKSTVTGSGISTDFIGINNYIELFKNELFWESLRRTFYFTAVSLLIEMVLGTLMALVLNQNFKGAKFLRGLVLLPWAVPTVVNARLWQWIFIGNDYGAFNKLFMKLGLISDPVVWLSDDVPFKAIPLIGDFFEWLGASRAINMIILGDTWKTVPLVTLLLLAGLQTIPDSYYEAASIDGASKWKSFWAITLPMLNPVIIVILVLRTMELFRVFDIIYIMMGYQINVLSILTFQEGMVYTHLGKGSALSFIIGLIILLISLVYINALKEKKPAS